MQPVLRWVRLGLLAALLGGMLDPSQVRGVSARQPMRSQLVKLVADTAAPPSYQSDNPDDYVQIRNGKFVLAGKPFVIKGTNYFGSWRHNSTIDVGNGIEHATAWALYHDWDSHTVNLDFEFIRSQLNATAVRIGTPAEAEFASLARYHGYQSWFKPDGAVADLYRSELIDLADIAYANGVRIQFCLLWNVAAEIAKDPDAFKPGGQMDRFYSNQVRSVVAALSRHPGVIAYSIGNEVLVNWPINGTHTSWYEGLAAGFILRRMQELRAIAPYQLLTTDEGAAAKAGQWYAPGPEFAALPGVDDGNGSQSLRLADVVDYLGPHFYPEALQPADLADGFASKIADAKQQLAIYLEAAKGRRKPVVIDEFGLPMPRPIVPPEQYSTIRDRYFEAVISEGETLGLQGLLAWDAVPEVALSPGQYSVRESKVNSYSQTELDIDEHGHTQRRILFYDPSFNLFEWQYESAIPNATSAARAVAAGWPTIP